MFSLNERTKNFFAKAKDIYSDKFDLSKINYVNNSTKVCIICPIHGEFWMTPNDFLDGHICPKCADENRGHKLALTKELFIEKAKRIHGDKYDYSKVVYFNSDTKVCIICPVHGEFWQTPHSHLNGLGCKKCGIEKRTRQRSLTTEQFIQKAKEIHGNKYDYSKVHYTNGKNKICIICPIHGEFWQRAEDHLRGHGCYQCNDSKIETEVKILLDKKNIVYEHNKFYDFLDGLQLDFFIPSLNIGIECQGLQHFKENEYFGGEKSFLEQQQRDKKKQVLCETHGIKLLYYSNDKHKLPKNVIKNKEKLLEIIEQCGKKNMTNI